MVAQVKDRLKEASRLIRQWSQDHSDSKMPRQWQLTKTRLSLKGQKFVHFVGKGWQCKVVLGFLVHFLNGLDDMDIDPMLKTTCWAAQNFLGVLTDSRQTSLFLQPQEITQVQMVGTLFLQCYLQLRVKFENWCLYRLFNIRPKWHLLCHMIADAVKAKNPETASTHMDEDFLKQMMRVGKKTHIKKTQSSLLKRYLTGLKIK